MNSDDRSCASPRQMSKANDQGRAREHEEDLLEGSEARSEIHGSRPRAKLLETELFTIEILSLGSGL
ncbi:hypothetical protein ACVIIZ_005338 [Bradyrhizobium sp. USDA 4523]|uniref:hypothetical protein n=1 Tax=unclassified Bradyrhizobium TaxID=2631580 RepID=UPI00209EDAFA|nr:MULTISPECIES: hypothetical protein [unclassified Bradyrhizobium]MCP1839041.1 hypothetical protein [Bradyrhizobium sp. USDA 4538]